ncbi:hypothetical protein [Microcoleus sp. B3-A4]|uniref:hypothetical protein n=1 Tax=Microcoleus sp. B3-A4 TaxID=2818653 RepID=UPI002FCFF17B
MKATLTAKLNYHPLPHPKIQSHPFAHVIPQDTGQPGKQRYPSSYIALKPDRPGSPLFSLVQNTSGKGEILEVVFRNGWGDMKRVVVAEKTRARARTQRHHPFSAHYM